MHKGQARSSEKGFGLLEVVVAMGLTTVVALGTLKMVDAISKSGKAAAAAGEVNLLRAEIHNLLALHPSACSLSLKTGLDKTASFDPDVTLPLKPNEDDIKRYELANSLEQIKLGSYVAARKGYKSGNFFVHWVRLFELDKQLRGVEVLHGLTARSFVATLDIAVSLGSAEQSSAQVRHIQIPLTISTNSAVGAKQNEIVHCKLAERTPTSQGGFAEVAQAVRRDGKQDVGSEAINRPISMVVGPRDAILAVNNAPFPKTHSDWENRTAETLDGMKCDETKGWYLTGCWGAGSETDIFAHPNGCITNDFDQHSKNDLVISCARLR